MRQHFPPITFVSRRRVYGLPFELSTKNGHKSLGLPYLYPIPNQLPPH